MFSVSLSIGDEGLARLVSVTGLAAYDIFAGNLTGEKIVGVADPEIIGLVFGSLEMIIGLGHIVDEIRMLICLPRDQCHVIGRAVVVRIVQAVCSHKMCVFTAKLRCALIHEFYKIML